MIDDPMSKLLMCLDGFEEVGDEEEDEDEEDEEAVFDGDTICGTGDFNLDFSWWVSCAFETEVVAVAEGGGG
ncbi:MAG: hypothetical protein GY694_13695 [Gammaproteobacteria bacterium]|nr:hypothetical protein [Gammaproteobacteria bacterium]